MATLARPPWPPMKSKRRPVKMPHTKSDSIKRPRSLMIELNLIPRKLCRLCYRMGLSSTSSSARLIPECPWVKWAYLSIGKILKFKREFFKKRGTLNKGKDRLKSMRRLPKV